MVKDSGIKQFLRQITVIQAAAFVSLTAIILRVGMWFLYGPVNYSDSASYRRLAGQILEGWINYDGSRVPGYPAFLALVGSDDKVYFIQLLLGFFITLGFFYIGWRITDQPWFGIAAAMVHQFNLGQLFFEANVLTETLATFFVVASLVCVLEGIFNPAARKWWLAFLSGLASVFAILIRANFIILPPWLFIWIILGWQDLNKPNQGIKSIYAQIKSWLTFVFSSFRKLWLVTIAFTIPVIAFVGLWVGFIRVHYHDWALSTMTGYHLIQHTGAFFEYVPDEYAVIRDTYLQFRDARIAEFGTQTNTIWYAIPEMERTSGLNFYDLSRTLSKISVQLIRDHPVLFLRGVVDGWWLFWRAPVYWSPQGIHSLVFAQPQMINTIHNLILVQRLIIFGANMFFIISPVLLFIGQRIDGRYGKKIDPKIVSSWILLLGTVWLTSIVSSLLDHGDNPRFLIPLQSLVTIWVIWWIWQCFPALIQAIKAKFAAKGARSYG